ncbi:hypothetical protein [Tessaracoccus lacteus]|uniref:S1 motif domain-containing protein n=1 Tax=Tessaracoccus lacteus TaxID=3041766 RepID=A0ABY8PXE2_9ACTN|nr:hypothetical protein [Tessaracoccus sp. T21]WGT47158.1 hypothetical protein QH948_13755 [Tessaracoccus sp. T21]
MVVSIPATREEPWIDVEEIAREAGELADVYLMPTGEASWEFSDRMPDGTQVYGGAGRVYPVGHEWSRDLRISPLHFAWGSRDGEKATQDLISDMFRMAVAAGLLQTKPTRFLREVTALVKLVVAGRALVDVGNRLPATIAEELTVEDVAIERLLAAGQRVHGWYDPQTNRVDVTKSLIDPATALGAYSVGDVVLARVSAVHNESAELLLYPKTLAPAVTATIRPEDVTSNPLDDLNILMTVGEVVTARLASTGPVWALTLSDVDDDETVVPAPALLDGGPPWLIEDPVEPDPCDEDEAEIVPPLQVTPPAAPAEPVTAVEPRPTPLQIPLPGPPRQRDMKAPAATPTRTLLLQIDGLKAEIGRLNKEVATWKSEVDAAADEREQLRYLYEQAERRANRAASELKSTKARLRKAGNLNPAGADDEPRFADAEQGFRYRVLGQWAKRTIQSEQAELQLGEYLIGPQFLESVATLEGIKAEKIADVVVEIVTGRASQITGREVHRLRTGTGGADPVRVRADGAVAWRASLQINTASARRIHYWALPDGRFELSRVALHDDFSI